MNKLKDRARPVFPNGAEPSPAPETISDGLGTSLVPGIPLDSSRIKNIDIFSILPDPTQPRRAIPSIVRAEWDGNPSMMQRVFRDWVALSENERGGHPLFVERRLSGEDIEDADGVISGPITEALLAVVGLAVSIINEGLTNPITVYKTVHGHTIVTGERRWLAFHLLYFYSTGDTKWSSIPARVMGKLDRFAQATENAQRANLNAIGRVRQFALLLMALYEEQGAQFEPLGVFGHERQFYAQVADAKEWRVPHGQGARLLNACGVTDRSMLSDYRRMLMVADDVWTVADDENWSEEKLLGTPNNLGNAKSEPTPPSGKPATSKPDFFAQFEDVEDKTLKWAKRAGGSEKRVLADRLRRLADVIEGKG